MRCVKCLPQHLVYSDPWKNWLCFGEVTAFWDPALDRLPRGSCLQKLLYQQLMYR